MKKLIAFLLLFTVVAMVSFQACSKDDNEEVVQQIQPNQAPQAYAGIDTAIIIGFCEPKGVAQLDGHLSYDPDDSNPLKFLWKQVSGPIWAFDGVDSTRAIVPINNLVVGDYMFELKVFDSKGISSTDVLNVFVYNNTGYKDLELDLTGPFNFSDNFQYYDYYYDEFAMAGNVSIAYEPFAWGFYETSDSSVINTQFSNFLNLYGTTFPTRFISGDCSVDFETLYLKGGGAFDGTIKLTAGSAFAGCESKIPDLPRLQMSGNLNAATKSITMKLKGRIIL